MPSGSMIFPEGRTVTVRVPATSANLGPGFDTLGLALAFYDELTVTVRSDNAINITVSGEGSPESNSPVLTDGKNLVVRSIQRVFDQIGVSMPGLDIQARNTIPHSRGLGSSSAAIVSGVLAAQGLLSTEYSLSKQDMFPLAAELEGHPDNVAPALFGELTISWIEGTTPRCTRLEVHKKVAPLVFVPSFTLSTKHARSLQPITVPLEDAVFNVSRSSLLVAALTTNPELLFEATEDRLHQNYRAEAMPETQELIQILREHEHAAVVSGAGPTILVLCSDVSQRFEAKELVMKNQQTLWESRELDVDYAGALVEIQN